jgi:O-succinylbenzoic acid--CoA ligase
MNCPSRNHLQRFLDLAADHWLLGEIEAADFNQIAQDQFNQFHQFFNTYHYCPYVLLVESRPVQFLARLIAAVAAGCPLFLGNPHWQKQEWQQVFTQVQPDIILGEVPFDQPKFETGHHHLSGDFIMIPTGGTSGQIKFAVHTWKTLTASAQGFQQYFQRSSINSYCTLPLYHVSGLMQFIRSFTSGGQLVIQSFKTAQLGNYIKIDPADFLFL